MRAIWKGHISFGLVSVPVRLYSAEQKADLQLHLIDSKNYSRIRYERVNAETGEEVPWDRAVKGYEYDDGNYVVLGKDELKQAAPEATRSIDIEEFVDLADIDPLFFDKPYFLEPDGRGAKAYALLREAMRESGRAGIARVVIRTRQYVAAMIPRGDGLVLNLLRYQQELRSIEELDLPGDLEEVGVKKTELKMARDLVKSMSGEWDPASYHDEYRERVMAWIEERIAAGEVEQAPDVQPAAERDELAPINLMDALKQSLDSGAGGGGKKAAGGRKSSRKAG
ncbi:MAG TPA: Ku protein [Myxococcota bacterium]|nr:Ku protein [Myxococcota bacterium]